ncbi:MAG: adenylyltransferase/cytidyltransferase family protein [Chloroflexi bacterium]|nr:adenylyltransferase/cytidyltransferase family protein [Chloroflexota bacterium]MBI3733176.1 adenylyltransferase/cytidyltransferase family protein [Chloroflexota bacterium]
MSKIITLDEAAGLRARYRTRVFTNGVFDLLHVGHVRCLQAARALGDCLIVGLNSDESARALKGEGRPLTPQDERAEILAALACVDYVVIFDALTAEHAVEVIQPDVYVKGGDYGPGGKVPPEAQAAAAYGGRVEFIPYVASRSTSRLIARLQEHF